MTAGQWARSFYEEAMDRRKAVGEGLHPAVWDWFYRPQKSRSSHPAVGSAIAKMATTQSLYNAEMRRLLDDAVTRGTGMAFVTPDGKVDHIPVEGWMHPPPPDETDDAGRSS